MKLVSSLKIHVSRLWTAFPLTTFSAKKNMPESIQRGFITIGASRMRLAHFFFVACIVAAIPSTVWAQTAVKPRVLLMVDTSGSMT